MQAYLFAFTAAFLLSLIGTRLARTWAIRFEILDRPDGQRKTHDGPIPAVGGVAIYCAMAIVLGVIMTRVPPGMFDGRPLTPFLATLGGATVMFALGLLDDVVGLRARTKVLVQIAVAIGMVAAGVSISTIALPGGAIELPFIVSAGITVLWIVGLTNAFNLIDGADGVAGGSALFAAAALAVVSIMTGSFLAGLAALAIAGATLGFLFFNFPPATIFLGDSGSLLLGFSLASVGLMSAQTAPTLLAVAIPVVSCGLPILDTLLTMMRRFLRGQPIFNADRGHIHHRLRDLGQSPRRVVMHLYAASATFALLSLLLVHPDGRIVGTFMVVAGAVILIAVQRLHIPELLEVGRIVDRGLHQRKLIANNVRIRDAIELLRAAKTARDAIDALQWGVATGDIVRAEVWTNGNVGAHLMRSGVARKDGAGALWEWSRDNDDGDVWEIRLPFRDGDGVVTGRLSLWHSSRVDHVLIDMRLFAMDLHPELQRALQRVHDAAPVLSPAADEPIPVRAEMQLMAQ